MVAAFRAFVRTAMSKTFAELLDTENEDEPQVEAQEAEPVVEQTEPETATEPKPRDESGKFVKKGDEGASPAPPEEKQEFDGAATIAERRKRQEAEERAARLEAEIAEFKRQREQPREETPPPDIFEDTEGWQSHLQSQFQQALYQQSFMMSDRFARTTHGDDLVNEAMEWGKRRCDADPHFNQQVINSGDPVGYAVKEFQRNQIVESVTPDDFAAFQAWKAAQAQQPPPAAPAAPPPTLTGERNVAGRTAPPDLGPSTFGEALGR